MAAPKPRIDPGYAEAAADQVARGQSPIEIARRLHISTVSVWRIAKKGPAIVETSRRCGGCGGKILPGPCRLCETRAYVADRLEIDASEERELAMQ